MYTPLHSTRLYEQVVSRIRGQIIDETLKAGDKLPTERELAQQFGVSRTVVREAIRALSREGLVEALHGRGTFVTNRTSLMLSRSLDLMLNIGGVDKFDKFNDLVEFRELVEPGIAELAALRATADDVRALHAAVNKMDEAMNDVETYITFDHQFHLALAHATQNRIIPSLLDPIVDLLNSQREKIFHVPDGPQRGQYHHKRILKAIEQHDPIAAREAMTTHLRQVREHIAAFEQLADQDGSAGTHKGMNRA